MAGRLGNKKVTIQNLKILNIDTENNLIILKGAVPGHKGSIIKIVDAVKKNQKIILNEDKNKNINKDTSSDNSGDSNMKLSENSQESKGSESKKTEATTSENTENEKIQENVENDNLEEEKKNNKSIPDTK